MLKRRKAIGERSGGANEEFAQLYSECWQRLYRLAQGILDSDALAKDVVQDVFVDYFERSSLMVVENKSACLYQAVRYACFMHLRSGRISQKHLQRINFIQHAQDVEHKIYLRELETALDDEVKALPDKCREVFYLSCYQFLPNAEIASRLHISIKTVENQLTKALKRLRVSLDKMAVLALIIFS